MDTLEIKELLQKTFGNHFEFHPDFYREYVDAVKKSGLERQLTKLFLRRLNAIIELDDADFGPKWLEHLKEYDNMYSLHLDTEGANYRLLYSKKANGKIFLRMFYEKEGKKATSYKKNVPIAIARRDKK